MDDLQNYNAIIIDDHILFAESLSTILDKFKIFKAIYILRTETEITRFFLQKSIMDTSGTVIFVDYYMPEINGLTIVREIRKMQKKVKVVFLSSVSNPMVLNEMLLATPDAIVNKSEGVEQVLEALRYIAVKQQYLSEVTKGILDRPEQIESPLSLREIELLNLFAIGLSVEKIAQSLHLSPLTVMTHKRNMMKKTNNKTLVGLVAYARKNGFIN